LNSKSEWIKQQLIQKIYGIWLIGDLSRSMENPLQINDSYSICVNAVNTDPNLLWNLGLGLLSSSSSSPTTIQNSDSTGSIFSGRYGPLQTDHIIHAFGAPCSYSSLYIDNQKNVMNRDRKSMQILDGLKITSPSNKAGFDWNSFRLPSSFTSGKWWIEIETLSDQFNGQIVLLNEADRAFIEICELKGKHRIGLGIDLTNNLRPTVCMNESISQSSFNPKYINFDLSSSKKTKIRSWYVHIWMDISCEMIIRTTTGLNIEENNNNNDENKNKEMKMKNRLEKKDGFEWMDPDFSKDDSNEILDTMNAEVELCKLILTWYDHNLNLNLMFDEYDNSYDIENKNRKYKRRIEERNKMSIIFDDELLGNSIKWLICVENALLFAVVKNSNILDKMNIDNDNDGGGDDDNDKMLTKVSERMLNYMDDNKNVVNIRLVDSIGRSCIMYNPSKCKLLEMIRLGYSMNMLDKSKVHLLAYLEDAYVGACMIEHKADVNMELVNGRVSYDFHKYNLKINLVLEFI